MKTAGYERSASLPPRLHADGADRRRRVLLASIDAAGQPRTRGRIDVHHHCRTPAQGAGRAPGADWSPQKSIEQMDKFGIATSLISATVPAEPFYDGTEKSRTVARSVNDFIAKWIGDTSFTPVLDELNRRRAFVYTHGAAPGCCGGSFVPGVPEITVEYNTDVSRAIVSLLTSGTADRTPNVGVSAFAWRGHDYGSRGPDPRRRGERRATRRDSGRQPAPVPSAALLL